MIRPTTLLLLCACSSVPGLAQQGIAPAGPFCENEPTQTLMATPIGGTWGGAVDTSGVFDPAIGSSNSPYLVTYAWTDTLGMDQVDSALIDVLGVPIITLIPAGPYCTTSGVQQLVAFPVGGVWGGNTPAIGDTGSFNPIFGPQGSPYTVWYTYTAPNGCVAVDTMLVIVYPTPMVTAVDPGPICLLSDPVQLQAAPIGGIWSGDVDSTGIVDPPLFGPGNFFALYTFTDSIGCTNSAPLQIQVLDQQVATIAPTDPICADAGSQFIWAQPFFGTYGGAADAFGNVDPSLLGIGQHLVTYTFQCMDCCPYTDSILIDIVALPEPQILSNDACLSQDSVFLQALPSGGNWSGMVEADGLFRPSQAGLGQFEVIYSYQDSSGCVGNDTNLISVLPTPTINIQQAGPYCAGATGDTLIATPVGGVWSGSADAFGFFEPGTQPGQQSVYYEYGDSVSCSYTDTLVIEILALPNVQIDTAGAFCSTDAPVQLTAQPLGGIWSGASDPNGVIDPTQAAGGGILPVIYLYSDSNGCSASDSMDISIVASPEIMFDENGPYCTGSGSQQLIAAPNNGVWGGAADPFGMFDADQPAGAYAVTYSINDGVCFVTATDTVVIDPCFGIEEMGAVQVQLGPSPADDVIILSWDPVQVGSIVTLHDLEGRLVEKWNGAFSGQAMLSVAHLSSGTYLITVPELGRPLRVVIAH